MNRYLCPFCQAQLNVHGYLVLTIHCESSEKGVVLLSDNLGDYTAHMSNNIHLQPGDKAHFHCPACAHSLEYKQNKNLARVIRVDERDRESMVVFSAIFGEQCTYEISEERTLSFGENAVRYMDPDWYRKA